MAHDQSDAATLKIDARVVRQLGAELITDPEQALLELIKNAYDADADRCRVEIDTTHEAFLVDGQSRLDDQSGEVRNAQTLKSRMLRGRITVEDDGPGISLATIKDRWLLISGSNKRPDNGQIKSVTEKGRTPLGDKGIGRLGTMRLGDLVQFISRPKGSKQVAEGVEFCWSEFNSVRSLDQVTIRDVMDFPHDGYSTRVMIEGLEEPEHWIEKDQSQLQARISKLVSPFSDRHAMRVSVSVNGTALELQKLQQDLELYATARHSFSFKRYPNGKIQLELTSYLTREFFGSKWNPNNLERFISNHISAKPSFGLRILDRRGKTDRWHYTLHREFNCETLPGFDSTAYPGDFKGEIYVVSFGVIPAPADDIDAISPNNITPPSGALKFLFQKLAGVAIYRDGFGVRIDPDWLDMSAGVTSGGSWYGLRRTNTVGHVDISSSNNAALVEKSDREGFVDTPAWRQFNLIARKVRDEINSINEELRRGYANLLKSKISSSSGRPTPEGALKQLATDAQYARDARDTLQKQQNLIAQAVQFVDQSADSASKLAGDAFKREAISALNALKVLNETPIPGASEEALQLLKEEIRALRTQVRTAYDFIAAGMAAETLAHEVHPLLDFATQRISSADRSARSAGLSDIATDLQSARAYLRLIGKQLSMLNPMLKVYRETRDTLNIVSFLEDYGTYAKSRMDDAGITLTISSLQPFEVRLPRGRLMQVVDNLVRNSEYWLDIPEMKNLAEKPEITICAAKPQIFIWDNGLGIRRELEDRIFEMFVSDKPREIGRGLGLYIVKEALIRYGCDIHLSDERNIHGRRFKFEIDLTSATQ